MQLTDLFNYLGYARLGAPAPPQPVHAHDPPGGVRPGLRVLELAQPAQPVRAAVHRAHLSAGAGVAAGRLLGGEGGHGRRWPRLRRARRPDRAPARAATRASRWRSWPSTRSSSSTRSRASTTTSSCWCRCWGRSRWCSARRYRSAGVVLMLAVAVKFTAVLLLPFLLVAAHTRQRRVQVLVGAAIARGAADRARPRAVRVLAAQPLRSRARCSPASASPTCSGCCSASAGTPALLKIAAVGVVLVVAHQFYRNRDWIGGAGWSTLALDRQPELADAVVRGVAAAAGRAGDRACACAGWRRRSPCTCCSCSSRRSTRTPTTTTSTCSTRQPAGPASSLQYKLGH